jgi:DNA polymerase III subunit chi
VNQKPLVIYFSIKDPAQKLSLLCSISQKHLSHKQPLHILAADRTSLNFVSQLLWKEPKDGFIVHSDSPGDDREMLIQLTLPLPSYAGAESIFNLTAQALIVPTPLKKIYEFEDLSHPSKKALFEKKFIAYQEAGYTLSQMG